MYRIYPDYEAKSIKKLALKQKELSRKQLGSNNRKRARRVRDYSAVQRRSLL